MENQELKVNKVGSRQSNASHQIASQPQHQVILRFLSSDECNSSQSIFSSSSREDNDENELIHDNQGEVMSRGAFLSSAVEEPANMSLTSRGKQNMMQANESSNAQHALLMQLQSRDYADETVQKLQTESSSGCCFAQESSLSKLKKESRNNLNQGSMISAEPYFSSNAQNDAAVSSTFYGQKQPKAAIYQSLVHKENAPNQAAMTNQKLSSAEKIFSQNMYSKDQQESSRLTECDEKSRNDQFGSKTKLVPQQNSTGYLNSKISQADGERTLKRKILMDMPPMELASVRRYYSLKPDMAFGWRPEDIHGAPIPMYFDYEQNDLPLNQESGQDYPIYFLGSRFNDSLDMHQRFANKTKMRGPDEIASYHFKFPPNQNVIDAMGQPHGGNTSKIRQVVTGVQKMFVGMNPLLSEPTVDQALPLLKGQGKDFSRDFLYRSQQTLKTIAGPNHTHLLFDSSFESGNLDMAIQVQPNEYDCYMRVDSNTRGHHQWFYFKIQNQKKVGTVKFNFVNFTKRQSLYMHGMRVNVKSMLDIADQKAKLAPGTPVTALKNEGWVKTGANITYKLSKLSLMHPSTYQCANSYVDSNGVQQVNQVTIRRKKYYQLSFEYTFKRQDDEVYFAYALPYTFSKAHNLVKEIMLNHKERVNELEKGNTGMAFCQEGEQMAPQQHQIPVSYSEYAYIRESRFCYSLSGLEVPELTITSQVNKLSGRPNGSPLEIDPAEFDSKCKVPLYKYKKYMIVAARVHPGESNASYIMQGFLKFITGNSQEAINLRKRNIFKVIPMTNPDGVIAGNYRTSLSGNDLNRQFLTPNPKLHPTVDSIKKLCSDIMTHARQSDPIAGFIDIHGHSRKKSVFMYGPHYPLHNERYLKSKILPKILDDKTQMFRFYSCKFRIEKSKIKTARVVLFKEFGIMNCFTLEASFHGFIDSDRSTTEFTTESLEGMGATLANSMNEYADLVDEDERQKALVREAMKNKKKRLKARDIAKAIIRQEKNMVVNRDGLEAGNNNSEDNTTDMESVCASKINNNIAQPSKGVRSLSIQNNSTKVSSLSENNNSDDGNNAVRKRQGEAATRMAAQSSSTATNNNNNNQKENALTSDIMELISEEELSVCRSEGSPPRKNKKRKKTSVVENPNNGNAVVDINNPQAQAVIKYPKAGPGPSTSGKTGKRTAINQKNGNSGNSNFRIRPERAKRLSSAQDAKLNHLDSDSNAAAGKGKVLTMSAMLNQIKKKQQEGSEGEDSGDANGDDESSCGKSFSGDELSESDLKDVQGDILGAIRRFDDIYNRGGMSKDKYAKERQQEPRKQKKTANKDAALAKETEKRKLKVKREDLMNAAKNAQPAVVMPFQVKGSGNGGNSCTLVMERIMQERQRSQQPPAVFMSSNSQNKQQQASFGFMQRHKKSLNPIEKDAQSRAITDINFNVPNHRNNFTSNLEQNQTANKGRQLVQGGSKRRETSLGMGSNVPVGVKGLAAISDLRNSTKHNQGEIKRQMKSFERPTYNAAADHYHNEKSKVGGSQRQSGAPKPSRFLKQSSTSVTAKSPTNLVSQSTTSGGGGGVTASSSKATASSKMMAPPKTQKPTDGPKLQQANNNNNIITAAQQQPPGHEFIVGSSISSGHHHHQHNSNNMPPLTQCKQTPKAELSSGEGLKYIPGPILSKSQTKTAPVAVEHSPQNLPSVQNQQCIQSDAPTQQDPATSASQDRKSKGKLLSNSSQSQNLEEPKIISMTTKVPLNQYHQHQHKQTTKDYQPHHQQQQLMAGAQKQPGNISEYVSAEGATSSVASKNPTANYRVKSTKRRNYLGSQRCSSGNINQRSKVTSLAKENAFLSKLSSFVSGTGVQAAGAPPQLMAIGQQTTLPKQTFSLKYQIHHNNHQLPPQPQQTSSNQVSAALTGSNSQQSSSHQHQQYQTSYVQQQASHRQQVMEDSMNCQPVRPVKMASQNQPQGSSSYSAAALFPASAIALNSNRGNQPKQQAVAPGIGMDGCSEATKVGKAISSHQQQSASAFAVMQSSTGVVGSGGAGPATSSAVTMSSYEFHKSGVASKRTSSGAVKRGCAANSAQVSSQATTLLAGSNNVTLNAGIGSSTDGNQGQNSKNATPQQVIYNNQCDLKTSNSRKQFMENYPLHNSGNSQMVSNQNHQIGGGSGRLLNEIGNQVRNNATVINFNKISLQKQKMNTTHESGNNNTSSILPNSSMRVKSLSKPSSSNNVAMLHDQQGYIPHANSNAGSNGGNCNITTYQHIGHQQQNDHHHPHPHPHHMTTGLQKYMATVAPLSDQMLSRYHLKED